MNKRDYLGLLLGLLLLIVLAGIYIAPSYASERALDERGRRAPGIVTEVVSHYSVKFLDYKYLVVQYIDDDNQYQHAKVYVTESYYNHAHSGDGVYIIYDPQQQSNARLADVENADPLWRHALLIYGSAGVVLLVLFFGVALYLKYRPVKPRHP